MADVAVLTLTRTPAYFERLLSGLERQRGGPSLRGVVVNNGSDEDVVRLAVEAGHWASLDFGYNTSFAEGNNEAATVWTDTDWLLLLNDDLVLDRPDFLAQLWAHRLDAEVVGAVLTHADGTVNHAGVCFHRVAGHPPASDHLGRGEPLDRWHSPGWFAITPSVTFAAALVQRELWDRLGGLSTAYYYGWEDTDFCLRALAKGARIGVARGAVATHGECGTRARNGKHDVANCRIFNQVWPEQELDALLRDYKAKHEDVEGIAWA